MIPVEFLTAILPQQGHVVIVTGGHPVKDAPGRTTMHLHLAKGLADAAAIANRLKGEFDVYFTPHTMRETVKKTSKAGRRYISVNRTAENAAFVQSFYLDLDVGQGSDKYRDQGEALAALKDFRKVTNLPTPMVVNSGRGVHAYWRFDEAVTSAEWKPAAEMLKRLAAHHGLKADPAVTADAARVLRVVGTFNRKDPANPLPVVAMHQGGPATPFSDLVAAIAAAAGEMPVSGAPVAVPAAIARPTTVPETPENIAAVRAMLAAIAPDVARGEWRNVVWGGASLGWTSGRELVREWSAQGEKFDEGEFAKVWDGFDPGRQGSIGVGSLVSRAIAAGYVGPNLTRVEPIATSSSAHGPLDLGAPPADAVADVANGRRFAAAARDRLLYIHDAAVWLKFDAASGWAVAAMVEVEAFAKFVVEAMHREAAEAWRQDRDGSEAKRLRANVDRVSRLPHMRAMIELAKSEPGMSASLADFDADPWLLGVQNGVVDLRTGELRPATPDLRVSKRCRVEFDPGAACPRFRAFLAEVLPDPEVRAFVARFMGYCLTGSVEEQAFLFLHGGGFNGKSVLVDILAWMLGDYARKIPTEMLMLQQRSAQGPDPDILMLKGLRLAYASETEDGRRLSEARVKDMTGGERLTARAPYASAPVEFDPTHKLLISGNHKPSISDTSHGMWRRVILLLFGVQVAEADRDPDLPAKLRGEAAGILNLALAGLRDWRAGRGLRVPASIKAATATYRAEQDILGEFLADECEIGEGFKAPKDNLNAAYDAWCIANRHKAVGANRLTKELGERGFGRDPGRRNYLGLRLKPPSLARPG